jgi:hypothetical protein
MTMYWTLRPNGVDKVIMYGLLYIVDELLTEIVAVHAMILPERVGDKRNVRRADRALNIAFKALGNLLLRKWHLDEVSESA